MNNWNEYFYYDETSPSFLRWRTNRLAGLNHNMILIYANSPVGTYDERSGYYRVSVNYNKEAAHRIIWEMNYFKIPRGFCIDHIDRNKINNNISNLRCIPIRVNSRNCKRSSVNKSGIGGVCKRNRKGYEDWCATWVSLDGKRKEKSFAVLKYGEDVAFSLAREYRAKMISKLNDSGAGYSRDHGIFLTNTQEQASLDLPSIY